MKPLDVIGGTFILGGTFQKNFCKGHLTCLLIKMTCFQDERVCNFELRLNLIVISNSYLGCDEQ